MKPSPVLIKETRRIALGAAALLLLENAVFFLLSLWPKAAALGAGWDYTVLLGSLYGSLIALGDFYLMGLTVQKAAAMTEELSAAQRVRSSYTSRLLAKLLLMVIAFILPFTNGIAALLCLFFPRLTIAFLQVTGGFDPKDAPEGADASEEKGR